MAKDKVKAKVSEGLRDESARMGRDRALRSIKPAMLKALARFPHLRDHLRDVKRHSIQHLDELLEKATRAMQERSIKVFVANTQQEALEYIGNIVGQGLVVKSKSNAAKEIGIVHYLEERGAKVVETDLGDRITQLDGSTPSHSLAPSIHIPIERVAKLFSQEVQEPLRPELEELVRAARKSLRRFLERADVGITGANAVIAETGSVIVTENEGNIRAVTSMPKVHIAIAGIEKIVPTLRDAISVIKNAAVFGVGQDIGTYVSILSGPSRFENDDLAFLGEAQGPREMYVVFLKAGREKAIQEGFEEAIYCINCGSCLNFCPIYAAIGEKFGYRYLGGRGAVFTAMHECLEKAEEAGLSLCIDCKHCEEACAVGMKTPEMIVHLRARLAEEKGLPLAKKAAFRELAANKLPGWVSLAKFFQSLGLNAVGDGMAKLRLPTENLPGDRLVPLLADQSFPEIVKRRRPQRGAKAGKRVAFFAGCVVNYLRPDLGMSVLELLEKQGVEVVTFPQEACCGIPALQNGDEADARTMARTNLELLVQEQFEHLLFVCPTCATTVKHEWPRLLAAEPELAEPARQMAAKAIDISSYLVQILGIPAPGAAVASRRVTYHDSCHLARGLKVTEEPRRLLQSIPGIELVEMAEPNACCGFGGSFSLSYYNLSRKINDDKIKQIAATNADGVVAACPGCVLHLKDGVYRAGGGQKVLHIVELLAEAYRKDGESK